MKTREEKIDSGWILVFLLIFWLTGNGILDFRFHSIFGSLAKMRKNWSFVVGMILYGLDSTLFLVFSDHLSLGFHIFALCGIYKGLDASIKLGKYE